MSVLLHLQWNSVVWKMREGIWIVARRCWEVGTGPARQPPGWPSNERHAAAEPQRLPVSGSRRLRRRLGARWSNDSRWHHLPPQGPASLLSSSPDTVSSAPTFLREASGRKCSITALTKGASAPSPRDSSFPGSLLTQVEEVGEAHWCRGGTFSISGAPVLWFPLPLAGLVKVKRQPAADFDRVEEPFQGG